MFNNISRFTGLGTVILLSTAHALHPGYKPLQAIHIQYYILQLTLAIGTVIEIYNFNISQVVASVTLIKIIIRQV